MSFSKDIRRFIESVDQKADTALRRTMLSIDRALVTRSPVGDPSKWADTTPVPPGYKGGRFRGNWQLSENSPKTNQLDVIDPDGNDTIGRLGEVSNNAKMGGVFYYSNNLPYAQALENGWSKQAPRGIVEVTKLEFQEYVKKALGEV